jgi:hypothetical protein
MAKENQHRSWRGNIDSRRPEDGISSAAGGQVSNESLSTNAAKARRNQRKCGGSEG